MKKKLELKKLSYELPKHFVSLDVETTGLYPEEDTILSISAVRYKDGKEVESINYFIDNSKNKFASENIQVSEYISRLTGINNDLIDDEGISLDDAIFNLMKLIDSDTVPMIVGQNVQFDLRFIYYNMIRFKINGYDAIPKWDRYDTYRFERKYHKSDSGYNLGFISERYGINLNDPHVSANDALATALVAMSQQHLINNNIYKDAIGEYVSDENAPLIRFKTKDGLAPLNQSVTGMIKQLVLNNDAKAELGIENWMESEFPASSIMQFKVISSELTPSFLGTFIDLLSRELLGYNSFRLSQLKVLEYISSNDYPISYVEKLINSYRLLFKRLKKNGQRGNLKIILLKTLMSIEFRNLSKTSILYKWDETNNYVDNLLNDELSLSIIKKAIKDSLHIKNYVQTHHLIIPEFFMLGGYTDQISSGDGDYLLDNKIMDLKSGFTGFTIDHALQVVLYGIMGRHSDLAYWHDFDGTLELIYPFYGKRYTFNLNDLSVNFYEVLERVVVGYSLGNEN